jgi:hypothetical protein
MNTGGIKVEAPLPFDRSPAWTILGLGLIVTGTVILCVASNSN